jgi:hypothetical protein
MRSVTHHSSFVLAAALGGCLLATGPLAAHHGTAAYDLSQTQTLHASVTAFKWINPHGLIEVDSHAPGNTTQHWTVETAGLTILVRAGWSKTSLQPGMVVTLTGHPARNGESAMILERVVLEDGRALGNFVPR